MAVQPWHQPGGLLRAFLRQPQAAWSWTRVISSSTNAESMLSSFTHRGYAGFAAWRNLHQQQLPFLAGFTCLCPLLLPFSPHWEMLLYVALHGEALRIWQSPQTHKVQTLFSKSSMFRISPMPQHFHFHFLLAKQRRPILSPPWGAHTGLRTCCTAAFTSMSRKMSLWPSVLT